MNKLLTEENDRLQKQVSHLVYENGYFRQHSQNKALAAKDTSFESVVTSGQHQDANSTEFDPDTRNPYVVFMPEGLKTHMGGTMRLGSKHIHINKLFTMDSLRFLHCSTCRETTQLIYCNVLINSLCVMIT